MLLGVKGGAKYCDVCYEISVHACQDCSGKTFCKECCTKVHKYPDRHDHHPKLLESPSQNTCELSENQVDHDTSDSPDEETDKLFKDSMMVATMLKGLTVHNLENFKWK